MIFKAFILTVVVGSALSNPITLDDCLQDLTVFKKHEHGHHHDALPLFPTSNFYPVLPGQTVYPSQVAVLPTQSIYPSHPTVLPSQSVYPSSLQPAISGSVARPSFSGSLIVSDDSHFRLPLSSVRPAPLPGSLVIANEPHIHAIPSSTNPLNARKDLLDVLVAEREILNSKIDYLQAYQKPRETNKAH